MYLCVPVCAGVASFPQSIGDNVYISSDCVVEAGAIGSNVFIGRGCVIGRKSVLKDCCELAPHSVLPPESVVSSFTLVGGAPARPLAMLPDCTPMLMQRACLQFYERFRPVDEEGSRASGTTGGTTGGTGTGSEASGGGGGGVVTEWSGRGGSGTGSKEGKQATATSAGGSAEGVAPGARKESSHHTSTPKKH